jgi:hypothetical protein
VSGECAGSQNRSDGNRTQHGLEHFYSFLLISQTREGEPLPIFLEFVFSLQRTKQETEGIGKEFQENSYFSKYLIFYVFMTIAFDKDSKLPRSFERSNWPAYKVIF